MNTYLYEGPVYVHDTCVQDLFIAKTMAVSAKKALSNIAYRWKTANNRLPGTNVKLPGKIKEVLYGSN